MIKKYRAWFNRYFDWQTIGSEAFLATLLWISLSVICLMVLAFVGDPLV